jgi:hypothetical protein
MSEKMKVQATVPEKKDASGKVLQVQVGPFTIEVDSGTNAAEMVQMFGDEAVKSNCESNWTVTLQGNMRAGMKKGETQEQLQARLGSAKMGVATRGAVIDPVQAYLAQFASATPEKQAEMMNELKKRAAAQPVKK